MAKAGGYAGSESAYDTCGTLNLLEGQSVNTKWSVLLAFNSLLYLILSCLTFCVCLSTILWPLCVFGFGHICGGCGVLACLIVTGVFRYSKDGEACANSDLPVTADGVTFADHATTIQNLFIAQCVLIIFYNCCVGVLMSAGQQLCSLQCMICMGKNVEE